MSYCMICSKVFFQTWPTSGLKWWFFWFCFQVEGFYANKRKARTKKVLLEWSRKAAEKAIG